MKSGETGTGEEKLELGAKGCGKWRLGLVGQGD